MYLEMGHGFINHLLIIELNTNCFVELHKKLGLIKGIQFLFIKGIRVLDKCDDWC